MNLLILESPGKVKKVQEILGPGWKVAASYGHVRDLPEKEFGVDADDFFRIVYVPLEKSKATLAALTNLVKTADEVFLATDPDREGEAIAWHLAAALGLSVANTKRVVYGEITESAIKAALGAPRNIDTNLVAAQEGRRILDRFCGYMVSGPLSRVVTAKASAGRVQSPVLRLVVERERAIRSFTPTTHGEASRKAARQMSEKRFWFWTGCFSLLWATALCWTRPFCPEAGLHMVVGGMAIAASVYDWHTFQLPDVFTFGAALIGLAGYGLLLNWDALAGAGYGFVGMKAAQVFCRWRHGRECIGSGDTVLMVSLGAMTGISLLPGVMILALVCVTAYMRITSRPKAPLGPFLTFGALLMALASGGTE